MKFIIGKKIEMSRRFQPDGRVVPVTIIQAGPCTITQIKNRERDGYEAVQLGFGERKKLSKPLAGHLKDLPKHSFLHEFRVTGDKNWKKGDSVKVEIFTAGDIVKITGRSKGKGFQGVVKRHHFRGGPASHGHKDNLRAPGAIGAGEPQHVFKGTRMAGRMGGDRATVRNLEVIEVDPEKNWLVVKGAIPGARHNVLAITTLKEAKQSA